MPSATTSEPAPGQPATVRPALSRRRGGPLLRAFLALERGLRTVSTGAAMLALALASLFGLYQVLTRFVLSEPSDWTEVLTQTLIIWMVYLGAPLAFRSGALIAVDLCLNMSRGPFRRGLETFIALASLTFLGTVVYWGCQVAYRVRFQTVAGLDVSIAWAYAAIPLGAALAIPAVIARYLDPQTPPPAVVE